MKLFSSIVFFVISIAAIAQCPNAGFEQGNFSNWQGRTGNCCPISLPTAGIVNGRHTITSGTGTDPRTCNQVTVVAPGSNFSARLGNNNVGAEAEGLSYNFFVTPQSTLITYKYAVVFEDPGHLPSEQPRFESRVILQNGDTIDCTEYSVTAGGNIPGFQTCPGVDNQGNAILISYKGWTTVGVDVSAYVGQTVTLQFQTGDCTLGGHYGYAYIDATCGPLEAEVSYCAGSDSATVEAPEGFASYLWGNGDTSRIVQVDPLLWSSLSCTLVSFSGCVATIVANLTPTVADPQFSHQGECVGEVNFINSTTISNGSVSTYIWTFGDGSPSSNESNPSHQYFSPGIYTVILTLITDEGCASSYAQNVEIFPLPVSDFSHTYVCVGESVNFTNESQILSGYSVDSWEWSFGDGGVSQEFSPSHHYLAPGFYNVSLVSTEESCSDTVFSIVEVRERPLSVFSGTSVCEGLPSIFSENSQLPGWSFSQNYFWDFGYGGSTSFLQNPSMIYEFPGTYEISLVVTSQGGNYSCSDTSYSEVEIFPNPESFFQANDACERDTVFFQNDSYIESGSIINYVWSFGNGSSTNLFEPFYVYPQSGIYDVQLITTSENFCKDTLELPVLIHPEPDFSLVLPLSRGCVPHTASFSSNFSSAAYWVWDFGDGNFSSNQNTSHVYTSPGTYDVSLTLITQEGCSSSETSPGAVEVYPNPSAYFVYMPQLVVDTLSTVSFDNLSQGGTLFYWDFGDGQASSEVNPLHEYSEGGNYNVELIVENQFGCLDTFEVDLFVKPTFSFFVPNSFSPNSNGKNDVWLPVYRNIKQFTYYIFDRWGELIFIGDLEKPGWDGTYKGVPVQNDVYVYQVKVMDKFNEVHVYRGRITIFDSRYAE